MASTFNYCHKQCQSSPLKMDAIGFIISFFLSKNLTLLTAFICWPPEDVVKLCRAAGERGARVRVVGAPPPLPPPLPLPHLAPAGDRREGIVLDLACPHAALVIDQASSSRTFNLRYGWLVLHESGANASLVQALLAGAAVLPDADVTWAAADALLDVYRVKEGQPLTVTALGADRTRSEREMQRLWEAFPTAVTRRKDLNNVYLKAATIITQPQHFKGWNDLTVRQIDTFPKLTYPLLMLCAEDFNFRYNLKQVDLYGEERNGSFDGLAGLLQRREVEVGITSMFMRADRLAVLDFSSETVELRGSFIFRQPSQSSVSNVFLLPFSRGVWAASAAVFLAAALLLAALSRRLLAADQMLAALTPAEAFTFAVGTICQQGFHMSPGVVSVRMVMLFTLLASLFAFTSYSAKIVVILQSPSDAIQTIDDLARSPMTLGVQETTYKRVYFAESNDPATKRLYQRKLLPLGERAYLSVVDGVARLRTGLFAFQVEVSAAYEIISKTFTEREKCGLQHIQAFQLPMVAVPIRRLSGYRDLFAARLRWQRETGLMGRARRVWLTERARCEAGGAGFVSVRLADAWPAVQVLAGGALLAALLLVAELVAARAGAGAAVRGTCAVRLVLLLRVSAALLERAHSEMLG